MSNVHWCVASDYHGSKHGVGEAFLKKLSDLTEAQADEFLTKIHAFWERNAET